MITLQDIRHLHLELSSDCNARCPQCPRNFHGYPYNVGYEVTNLTLAKVRELLPIAVVRQLTEILINGNYGDFVMNPESLDIISWFRELNPTMKIDISTNGGARDKEFWTKLAQYNPVVSFCIDGLSDTHAIYRQNTVYETVIKNAQTFIEHGGHAVWCMTEFDHNSHQFDEAEKLSKELGFIKFNRRVSSRDKGPVYDKQGNKVFVMKQASDVYPDKIDDAHIRKFKGTSLLTSEYKPVACEALDQKSLYISAEGTIDPCCHVGMNKPKFTWWDKDPELRQGFFPITLEEGIRWFNSIEESFDTDSQMAVCSRVCGK